MPIELVEDIPLTFISIGLLGCRVFVLFVIFCIILHVVFVYYQYLMLDYYNTIFSL